MNLSSGPTMPARARAFQARARARRLYSELQDERTEIIEALHLTSDRKGRGMLLTRAAIVTERLAGEHTAAWGEEGAAESLKAASELLRHAAASEYNVSGHSGRDTTALRYYAVPRLGDEHTAEVKAWTILAEVHDAAWRAVYLRRIGELAAARVGPEAAAALLMVAATEVSVARGATRPPSRYAPMLPRVIIGAVIAALMLAVGVPALGRRGALAAAGAAAAVYTVVYGVGYVTARVRAVRARRATEQPAEQPTD